MSFKIGLLVSGKLGYEVMLNIYKEFHIEFICTDKNSSDIIAFCESESIALFIGNPRRGKAFAFLSNYKIDLLLSINYLFLIEADMISLPQQYAINIHGSLLPKYRGRTPHVWAIINNEKEVGITAHLIDESCDTGAILLQQHIPVEKSDSGYTLLQKYSQVYPDFAKQIVNKAILGGLIPIPQDNNKATYFGKRTPDDGLINWDWQRERIYNWVRAQSNPYPGAFSYYQINKVIINEITFSDLGFHYDIPNGTILKADGKYPIIKTPNGAIVLENWHSSEKLEFIKDGFFYAGH